MSYILRTATPDEIRRWDDLVATNPGGGEIFQTTSFATLKSGGKWQIRYMIYENDIEQVAALMLERSFPLIGTQLYCPMGPDILPRQLGDILDANKQYAKAHRDVFSFKMESSLPADIALPASVRRVKTIQPHAAITCIVKFDGSEDDLFMSYKARARNLIRNAEKNGVTIRAVESNDENTRKMFALYSATAERNQFFVRPFEYYQKFWNQFARDGRGQMFFAEREGQLLSAGYVIWLGTRGYHKDGASPRGVALHNAPYLMQWYMQRWLMHKGIKTYEMIGVPPPDKLDDKSHPLYNLGVFKTAFNPVITEMLGTIDQVTSPARYARWQKFGQKVANRVARHLWRDSLY